MMTCMTPNLHEGLNTTDMSAILGKNVTTGTLSGDTETDPNVENSPPVEQLPDGDSGKGGANGGHGGRLLNCSIVNSTRTTISTNGTKITETTTSVKGPRECQSLFNASSSNNNGQSGRRQRRAIEIKDLESEPLNNNDLQFYIGFQFDGMNTYNNFTSLPVYEDPEYFKFEDEDHIRYFESKDPFLHVKVSYIEKAIDRDSSKLVDIHILEVISSQ